RGRQQPDDPHRQRRARRALDRPQAGRGRPRHPLGDPPRGHARGRLPAAPRRRVAGMNWTAIGAIIRKDVTTVLRNKGVRTPLLVAPVIILIVLPTFLILGGEVLASGGQVPVGVDGSTPFDRLAGATSADVTGIDVSSPGGWERFVLEGFIAPLYLLVPLMVAPVIAADSFAGERERKTLEALLHSPTSADELLVAKVLAAWVPAVVIGVGGFLVYCVVANV